MFDIKRPSWKNNAICLFPLYSYLHLTSAKAGGAAENAVTRKEDRYVDLEQTYTFIPLAFETLGPMIPWSLDQRRGILSRAGPPPRSHQR